MFWKKTKAKKKKSELDQLEQQYRDQLSEQTVVDRKPHQLKELISEQRELMNQMKQQYLQTKKEYQILTDYLKDIEAIEQLSPDIREKVNDIANQIVTLSKAQTETGQSEKKIPDAQFSMMQQLEDQIPDAINQLKGYEEEETKIKRDLSALDGEKANWQYEKSQLRKSDMRIKSISISSLVLIGGGMLILLILSLGFQVDVQMMVLILCLIGFVMAAVLSIRKQNAETQKRQADVCLNKAIVLQNKIKLKYVNIANAVDFEHEKYHVTNAQQFAYEWECYLTIKKEKEKLKQMNEDLNYFYEALVRALKPAELYDSHIWQDQASALADPREMVEIKHSLIVRRQKIRTRLESQIQNLNLKTKEVEILLKASQN